MNEEILSPFEINHAVLTPSCRTFFYSILQESIYVSMALPRDMFSLKNLQIDP